MSASRLNTEQLGRAFASSADAPASRSAERRRRIVILAWCTTVALAIGAVIGLSVWQGVQEKKKLRNLDIPLQSAQPDGFISNPSGDLQMKKMNNVLMAGAVASAASLGMCADAFAQSSAVQWTTASGGNGHWYQRNAQLMTWAQATAHAINIGGTLATTTTSSELEFIRSQLITDGAVCWLGGTIDCSGADGVCCTNCVWRWSNGENFNVAWSGWIPQNGFTTERLVTNGTGFDDMCSPCSVQDFRPPSIIEWSADCNADGIVDYGQCLNGTLPDYNGNNIPDCCDQGVACLAGNYPVQWHEMDGGNDHWYQGVTTEAPVSWTSARARAVALGSQLAAIGSRAEDDFLARLALENPLVWPIAVGYGPWLGGYQTSPSTNPFANWA